VRFKEAALYYFEMSGYAALLYVFEDRKGILTDGLICNPVTL